MTAVRLDPTAAPLRRRLGPVPWFVLEELLLLAGPDSIVETNVRALAAGLSLNKDTVARALRRLQAEGLLAHEPQETDRGRFVPGRYRPTPIPGLALLEAPLDPASPSRRVLRSSCGSQLSLIDDLHPAATDHAGSACRTTAGGVDALAPGVPPGPAPVLRDAKDRGRTPC